jgi:hypothetical protein
MVKALQQLCTTCYIITHIMAITITNIMVQEISIQGITAQQERDDLAAKWQGMSIHRE